jgi:hypothetical protein
MGMSEKWKFGMKWHGRLHKLVTIAATKSAIISSDPISDGHTTYLKDGRIHVTMREGTGSEKRIWFRPIDISNKPEQIDALHIFSLPYDSLPGYEIVDVDSFGCENPFVEVYVVSPGGDADSIKMTHHGERRLIKVPDIWVLLLFMDQSRPIRS